MTASGLCPWLFGKTRGRENILPSPLPFCKRVFSTERVRQINRAHSLGQIMFMETTGMSKLGP
jgi:hypothetical protein